MKLQSVKPFNKVSCQSLENSVPNSDLYMGHLTKKRPTIAMKKLRIPCPIQRLTRLLHLALSCITFTVDKFITFSVKMYYIYGWVDYYI